MGLARRGVNPSAELLSVQDHHHDKPDTHTHSHRHGGLRTYRQRPMKAKTAHALPVATENTHNAPTDKDQWRQTQSLTGNRGRSHPKRRQKKKTKINNWQETQRFILQKLEYKKWEELIWNPRVGTPIQGARPPFYRTSEEHMIMWDKSRFTWDSLSWLNSYSNP